MQSSNVEELGISSLSLVLSYLRGEGQEISADDEAHLAKVHALWPSWEWKGGCAGATSSSVKSR